MSLDWEALSRRQAPLGSPLTPEDMAFNNAPQILSITGTFFAAAAFVVMLRCYVRIAMLKVFGTDDYVMLLAMVLCTATFVCFKLRTDYGLGKHLMALFVDPHKLMELTKVQYVQAILIMVGISAVKISIAFCLLRLSVQRTYARILYGSIIFIVLMTIACAGTLIFQCLPVQAAWDSTLRPPPFGTGHAKCYSLDVFRNLGLMNSAFNIITDVLFASLPIPLIWQLQLNIRTKISLIIILSLGWFACAAAIIKAIKQWHVLTDLDWTVEDSFNVWNYIEFTVGIIAASLPTLKPLFNWFLEAARAMTTGNRSKGASYGVSGNSRGYQNKTEQWNKDIAMDSFPSKGDSSPTSSKSPYHVRITTQATGRADKEGWEAQRKDSDESIMPLQPHHALNSNGIVMTREVSVV
ncbi:Nn.00g010160.m01.CDS01 [Neocucurbitaria sp. VM-36]